MTRLEKLENDLMKEEKNFVEAKALQSWNANKDLLHQTKNKIEHLEFQIILEKKLLGGGNPPKNLNQ